MIYFITDGEYTKIGYTSSKSVKRRLASIQTGNVKKLEVLFTVDGTDHEEAWLHNKYSDNRVRGEWFDIDVSLNEIQEMLDKKRDESMIRLHDNSVDNIIRTNPMSSALYYEEKQRIQNFFNQQK